MSTFTDLSAANARIAELEAKDKEAETFCRELIWKLAAEKEIRIGYQDTVYAVCTELDKMLGNSPSKGMATGSKQEEVIAALGHAILKAKAEGERECDHVWLDVLEDVRRELLLGMTFENVCLVISARRQLKRPMFQTQEVVNV